MDHYNIPELPGYFAGNHPVGANTIIATGGLVAVDAAGNAWSAVSTLTGQVVGRADEGVDNTGGNAADKSVRVKRGVFSVALDANDPPTKAHIGKMVYAITADTVAHTGTCRAGKLIGFDAAGRAIVDTNATRNGPTVTPGNANSEISDLVISAAYSQAEVTALRDKCEELADDVRALIAALKTQGVIA